MASRKSSKALLTPKVKILSGVSFFTDIASEMIYPLLPLYIRSLGTGVIGLGLIEGIANAVAGIGKLYFGSMSDLSKKRNRFVQIGYGISGFSKPLIGLFETIIPISFLRFTDKFGKGVRNAPRDAILVAESTDKTIGTVFGFHRSMDTLGATLGPLVTLLLIYVFDWSIRSIILITIIPGTAAFLLTLKLGKEGKPKVAPARVKPKVTLKGASNFWHNASPVYKKLFFGLTLFAFVNSSDFFILLRAQQLLADNSLVLVAYICFNLVATIAGVPVGRLADRYGFKYPFVIGLSIFTVSYGLLSVDSLTVYGTLAVFAVYGLFVSANAVLTNAWVSLHVSKDVKATGLGLILAGSSGAFLLGNLFFASLWHWIEPSAAFSIISLMNIPIIVLFSTINDTKSLKNS